MLPRAECSGLGLMGNLYPTIGKRCLDLILGAVSFVALAPLMLFLGVLIRMLLGRPVLFRQRRVGKDGCVFMLYKFRSMLETRDGDGNLLAG